MQVREAMAKTISTAAPEETIDRAAALMKQEDCGFIPVVRGNEVVGVVTDRDLVLRVMANGPAGFPAIPVGEVMTRSVWSVGADEPIEVAAHLMAEHETSHLIVLQPQSGHPVGVLSTLDLAGVLAWGDG